MKISLFNNSNDTKPKASIVFEQYIENVKNGAWQDAVINVRKVKQVGTKEEYQDAKKKVPAVTASGVFSYRNSKGIEAHSGIIAIDIDAKDNPDGIPKDELAADAYTHALHHSIGGDGVVIYVRIDPDKHLDAFLGLEEYYLNNYKVSIDASCKDTARLRYVSWDIDLVYNEKSKVFKQYIPAKRVAPTNRVYTQQVSDIEHIINQCQSSRIDLTANYADWVRIGLAFASEYGERGRQYFHDVSSLNSGYDAGKCDKKYDNFLRSAKGGGVGIGTFVWLASLAGLETKTQRTTFIETVAKSHRNMIGQNGGMKDSKQAEQAAINYLQKMENIEGTDVQPIIAKVMQMDSTQVKNSLAGDIVKDAELYVKSLPLRFNEVLRKLEYKGEPVTDYTTNGLYIDALKALKDSQKGKSLGRELFETMINSPLVERYHPFMEFFSKYQNPNQDPKIVIDLLDCLIFKGYSEEDKEFLRLLVIKWLMSIIASMHGIHSVMCLVLCSSMGKGKTKFFRELLPKELRQYYTESSLDRDKDSDLEMCENLIICDDEFAGKSKKDANKLKALLSKQHFNTRAAYARRAEKYTRYAVLCGTSNEEDVLNDLEGNRRIIPLNIVNVDFAKYEKIDKTKLFIALLNLYEYDPSQFMLTADDIARLNATTVKNEESCMELEAFTMYFGAPEDYPNRYPVFMTPTEIKVYIENASRTLKVSLKKLGAVMKKLGFEKKQKKINRTAVYGYNVVKVDG